MIDDYRNHRAALLVHTLQSVTYGQDTGLQ